MPKDQREMRLTYELKTNSWKNFQTFIPLNDTDVLEIRKTKRVKTLRFNFA